MDPKKEARKLRLQGFSYRQIAKILGVSHATVINWLSDRKTKESWIEEAYRKMSREIKNRLNSLLLMKTEEKGRTRVLSYSQIYRLLTMEMGEVGINSLHRFYKFLDYYVDAEFGGKEKLELKRRNKKEASRYRRSKGKVRRTPGVIELDGTGYTWKDGKLYFVFLAREVYSGYFFDPYVIEAKDKSIKHYNKAITSYDIAKYLISLFEEWGLPEAIRTDNEKTLTSELITRALKELSVKIERTKPYSPNQKLVERAIRDIKDTLRHINTKTFDEAILQAIEIYNRSEHRFEHFSHPVIPSSVIETVSFRPADPDTVRFAFAERFIRKVRDNTISIDNLKYEFSCDYYPRASDYGRKRDLPEVLCLRLIDDATKLYVYDPETGKRLGTANLISTETAHLEPIDIKQEKNRQRRVRKRKEKLTEELQEIRKNEESCERVSGLLDFPFAEEVPQNEPQEEPQHDPFEIFLGGGEDAR